MEYALRVASRSLSNEYVYYTAQEGLQEIPPSAVIPPPKGVVISDVRFLNEVTAIRKAGGFVWKIERPIPGLEGAAGQHASEQEQNSIPRELFTTTLNNNNGPLDDLELLVNQGLAYARLNFHDHK